MMKSILCLAFLILTLLTTTTLAKYWNGIASASPPFDYVCYPNRTIVVDNTFVSGFRTSFANDSSRICTTTYNTVFTLLTITGCNLDDDILLVFTNRTEDLDPIIGGYGVDAYVLKCADIPDTGFNRTIVQGFSPTLSAAPVTSISPTVSLASALRRNYGFASPEVHTAVLTTHLYWTIDIPEEYYGQPAFCYVVSGEDAFDTTALRKNIIRDGCSLDTDLVGHFLSNIQRSPLRRHYTSFHVFKFYDSDYISIHCIVRFCRQANDCRALNCGGRRRRDLAPIGHVEEHVATTTLKVTQGPILFSGAETTGPVKALLLLLVCYFM